MLSKSGSIKGICAALLTLGAALAQTTVQAQTTAAPSSAPMQPGQKAAPAGMPSGTGMQGMQGMDMQSMMKDGHSKMAAMKMTGNADVDFAVMMRTHHQGAIDMAQIELRDGKAPEMQKMAKNIIAAQKKEIAQLDRFLAKNGQTTGAMKN